MNQELTSSQRKAALDKLGVKLPPGAADAMLKADEDMLKQQQEDTATKKKYAIEQMKSSGIAA